VPPPKRKAVAAGSEPVKPVKPDLPFDPKPKRSEGGNGKADSAWIAEMLEAGELQAPDMDSKPDDFYWEPIYQWVGLQEDLNPEFFEFFRRAGQHIPKCTGTAYVRDHRGGYVIDAEWHRLTRQCIGLPVKGANVCQAHGAKIPVVKAAAVRRLAEASDIVAMRLIGMTASVDEHNNFIDHKDRIAASNSVLDRVGIKGGVDIEISTPGFQRVLERMFAEDDKDE
jgi:hypothetical protein